MTCGIYAIECAATGKRYIGQSSNVRARWRDHRKQLRAFSHHNDYLQNAWTKHGPSAFTFRLLLECSPQNLDMYEQQVVDILKGTGAILYNLGEHVAVPSRGRSRPDNSRRLARMHADPEQRKRLRRGVEEYLDRIRGTEEAVRRATHASRSRPKKPQAPKMVRGSPEMRQSQSDRMKARLAANPELGVKRFAVRKAVQRTDTGEVFYTGAEAASALGVTAAAISYALRHGSGACRGVPLTFINNDTSVSTIKE